MATKPKLTPETIQKLEHVFAIDWTVEEACFYADIHKDTYYRWVKEDPTLLHKFTRLRNKPVLAARHEVVKGISNDKEFALKYLKNKRNKEFSERQEVDQETNMNITIKDIKNMSEEELNQFIETNQ